MRRPVHSARAANITLQYVKKLQGRFDGQWRAVYWGGPADAPVNSAGDYVDVR